MLLIYFLSDFEIVPVSLKFTGQNFVRTFQVRCNSVAQSMYFQFFRLPSIIIIIIIIRISHFSAFAGKHSPILDCSNQQD
jgi:hypothetical protein